MSLPPPLTDLSRVAVHTVTTRPWTLRECADAYAKRGFGGISVWREHLPSGGATEARGIIDDAGLDAVAVVRGGFFVSDDPIARARAVEDTREAIDVAAELGAPTVVIVPGAQPSIGRNDAAKHVADGLVPLCDHAASCGVQLGLEPLHPMFASDRSCLCTIPEAMDVMRIVGHSALSIVIDVYHVWWCQDLAQQIAHVGATGAATSFHVSDWTADIRNPLTSRVLMGEGCIQIRWIRGLVESIGFDGFVEVEILNDEVWKRDQDAWLDRIAAACLSSV